MPYLVLSNNLTPNFKPVATISTGHKKYNKLFIQTDVTRILKKGMIETSHLPCRAQVFVEKKQTNGNRLFPYDKPICFAGC